MTSSLESSLGHRALKRVAEEYREKGYDVVVHPKPKQLPRSFAGLAPDLLARRGEEVVVVEVKSRDSLRQSPLASELAKAVREQPGWRFEFVIVNPEHQIIMSGGAEAWREQDIRQRQQEVQALLDAGHEEAGLVLAWSAAEAAMRVALAREGLVPERSDPASLLKQLAFQAILERKDYDVLWRAMQTRNAVAHGHRSPDLDRKVVAELLEITSRLLEADDAEPEDASERT